MFRPRVSLFGFLLAFAPAIWADSIEVTTFVDENNQGATQGAGCSLREALHYMTLPILPEPEEEGEDPVREPDTDYRDDGWGGCKLAEGTKPSVGGDTIVLPFEIDEVEGVYQLSLGPLKATTTVTINGKENERAKYAHIKAAANQRIFLVDDGNDFALTRISLSLSQLLLEGNGLVPIVANECSFTANSSEENSLVNAWSPTPASGGGLILSCGEVVSLNKLTLKGGETAGDGGAVRVTHGAAFTASSVEFVNNKAVDGAVIKLSVDGVVVSTTTPAPTTEVPNPAPQPVYAKSTLQLSSSLLTENTASNGAVVGFAGAPGSLSVAELAGSGIVTTTISGNTGLAVMGAKGLAIANSTIVNNSAGGIDFLSLPDAVLVYNSVIAGNGLNGVFDCRNAVSDSGLDADKRVVRFNFFQNNAICAAAFSSNAPYSNTFALPIGVSQLMASDADCKARIGSSTGLLCPLADNGGETRTHRPRLPVFNGSPDANFASSVIVLAGDDAGCEATDQRGEQKREQGCDRGALQLKVSATAKPIITSINGARAALFSVDTKDEEGEDLPGYVALLGDIELLPAAQCEQVGIADVQTKIAAGRLFDGCLELDSAGHLITLDGKVATKGHISIGSYEDAEGVSQANSVIYTPYSAFHGTDEFSFRVATTLSRYSDGDISPATGQFAVVSVLVRGQPERGISDSSAGALGWRALMLLGLSLLLLTYRRQYV